MRGDHYTVANDEDMGMATAAQVQALRRASGPEVERQFLTLMIAHHRGGVTMAQAALELAQCPEVHPLTGAITTSQQSEIVQPLEAAVDPAAVAARRSVVENCSFSAAGGSPTGPPKS